MMLGSQGGLGVITSLNFKVLPNPVEPHSNLGIFHDEDWLVQVKDLLKLRLPLDWIQASYTHDSKWTLGLGYSGNLSKRNRIESEIINIFGKSMKILADGKSFSEDDLTPGEQRFEGFLEELSNWYIRRNRRRFWKSEDDDDKKAAYHVLYEVLSNTIRVLAPVLPFITEEIWGHLKSEQEDLLIVSEFPIIFDCKDNYKIKSRKHMHH